MALISSSLPDGRPNSLLIGSLASESPCPLRRCAANSWLSRSVFRFCREASPFFSFAAKNSESALIALPSSATTRTAAAAISSRPEAIVSTPRFICGSFMVAVRLLIESRVPLRPPPPASPSSRLSKAFCSCLIDPPSVSAAARADPPIWVSSSRRMIRCASALRPVSTRLLIRSFWSLENWTPARARAVMPLTGSCSALPTCRAALLRSVPIAVLRFSTASVAIGKTSRPILVKVRSSA